MRLIFFAFTLMFMFEASASQMRVIYVKPPVVVKHEGQEARALKKSDILKEGARIHVKEDGLAVLKGSEGSTVKLESGTVFEVTTLRKEFEKESTTLFSLARGAAFFFAHPDQSKAQKMKVRTSNSSFGVRGTEFFVAYGKGKGREEDIWMCVNSGVVESISRQSKKSVLVKAGEGVQVDPSGSISPPQYLPWTSKLNWNNDPENGDLKNRVSIEEAYASPLEMDFD